MTGKFCRTRVTDRKYLDWLRDQPCIFTGQSATDNESVVPMHIGTYGKAQKSDDEALPAINWFHQAAHNRGEISYIRENAPDWLLREAMRAYAREWYREWKEGKK